MSNSCPIDDESAVASESPTELTPVHAVDAATLLGLELCAIASGFSALLRFMTLEVDVHIFSGRA